MSDEGMVIVVECREANGESVIAFVGSSWPRVDSFVCDPGNNGYSSQDYQWHAQEIYVDNDDAVYSTGRTRVYDKMGSLLSDDTPSCVPPISAPASGGPEPSPE